MNAAREPIAITGCGWVTPFCAGTVSAVLSELSSRGEPDRTVAHLPVSDAALAEFEGIPAEARREKHVAIAAAGLRHALHDAAVTPAALASPRVGLSIGCALAGQLGMIDFAEDVRAQSARFVSPIRFPQTVGNYLAGAIARAFGIRGPSTTLARGTAGGLAAIIEAAAWLADGSADLAVAGGAEVFSAALAQSLQQGGPPLADAACIFILERLSDAEGRGARPLGRLAPFAAPADHGVVSAAGLARPGAAYLELWTGRSLAASGAAAVAGAVAANSGLPIPAGHGGPFTVAPPVKTAMAVAGDSPAGVMGLALAF